MKGRCNIDCVFCDVAIGWADRTNFGVYDRRGITRSGDVIYRGYGVVFMVDNVVYQWYGGMEIIIVCVVVGVVVGGGK